jgi:exopolyphosphatase/guanosine-5'-triphosphate,3'-diphosphate pyrophosphatase
VRYAAIDIGSNSIRMEAAEVLPGQAPTILASEREVTRLGESVFRMGAVGEDAAKSTCAVLSRMAALYRRLDVVGVRAVATSAVRDANNQAQFLARASEAAGTAVEIISGREEARLIHLGVESVWPQTGKRVLILDIGGGSAEIIAAEHGRLRDAYSRPLGAVRLREMFLQDDPPAPRDLHRMGEFIVEKLEPAARKLRGGGWDRAIATSATASAGAGAVSRLPRSKREEADRQRVTTSQVRQLYEKLSVMGLPARRKVTGIGPRRAEIIVPGIAVLLAFLREYKLSSFYYSRAGVRDGIIADLAARNVGSELSRLSREQRAEVEEMCRKFGVPLAHGRKVAEIAGMLFNALQPVHKLPAPAGKLVEAAAYLHDVGHYVSSVAHHKHSWYVVANSDMPGFTDRERLVVAALCRYHRKAMPSPAHHSFEALTPDEKRLLTLAIPILRVADNLDRSHSQRVRSVDCKFRDGEVLLQVHSDGEIDLETWAAERAGETFRQTYNRSLTIAKAK